MTYPYLKAIHIIFVVTWFAGMFYMPRLFIYNTEAQEKEHLERSILQAQFGIMMKRLWFGITWPSAVITLIMGPMVMLSGHWDRTLLDPSGRWLLIKLVLVALLYVYHYSLHRIFRQQQQHIFKYTSQQLRVWNEVATIFLITIVLLAVVKQGISLLWGAIGTVALILILLAAIRIYKQIRKKNVH